MPDRVDAATELVARPAAGRVHVSDARVRLGDVDPSGRLRLDGLARLLQDVANEDAVEAYGGGAPGPEVMAWVVRRTLIEVHRAARFREDLTVATWCGGLGGRWAERRVSVTGSHGARAEAAMLWVHLDPARGAPARLSPWFLERYGEAAGGRVVRARLRHPDPDPATTRHPWPLRSTDLDLLGHVNNAVHLAMVEDVLDDWPAADEALDLARPMRIEVEYRQPIDPGDQVDLAVATRPDGALALWVLVGEQVRASAVVVNLAA
ncbi:acyl-[acyl-carrier-protein] thioesterase [soil metagenome]